MLASKSLVLRLLSFSLILASSLAASTCHAQSDDIAAILHPDMRAFQTKLDGARYQKLKTASGSAGGWEWECNKEGHGNQVRDCAAIVARLQNEAAIDSPLLETALLKLCAVPSSEFNSCSGIAQLYETRKQYGLAMAAASYSGCKGDELVNQKNSVNCLEVKQRIYKKFNLRTEEVETLTALCRGVGGTTGDNDPCGQLKALANDVNISALVEARGNDETISEAQGRSSFEAKLAASDRGMAEAKEHQARVNELTSAISGAAYPNTVPVQPIYVPQARAPARQPPTGTAQAGAYKQQEAQARTTADARSASPSPSPYVPHAAYAYKGRSYQSYPDLIAAARADHNCALHPERGEDAPCDLAQTSTGPTSGMGGTGQFITPVDGHCVSVKFNGFGMGIVNSCNVKLTVQFVAMDGHFGGSCAIGPSSNCGTGWNQTEYTAHGGWDTYTCPDGYTATNMQGGAINAPHTVYQCMRLF